MARRKPREKAPPRKISETFLDFAKPLLEPLGANAVEAEMEPMLQIAFTVWNAVVFDAADGSGRWVSQVRGLLNKDPRARALVEQLISRKQRLFADDHRAIGEYQLYRHDGELRLRAEARQPPKHLARDP